jgi:outer membrane lipoprotein SlyB
MSATISSLGSIDPAGKREPTLGKSPDRKPVKERGELAGPAPATKPLWAAIGVLSVSLLAMGASLIHISKRPIDPLPVPLPVATNTAAQRAGTAVPLAPSAVGGNPIITETADGKPVASQAKAPDETAKPAIKKATRQTQQSNAVAPTPARSADGVVAANTPRTSQASATTPVPSPAVNATGNAPVVTSGQPSGAMGTPQPVPAAPVVQAAPAPVVAQAPARAVCANCGTIEAVTPITRPGKGASGVGTVAGGVLGGVLGRQVGSGTGRDLATVVGAVGGAVAGNAVEKNIKKETVYSVRVQMEDGSTRTIEQATAPAVGAKVRVDGTTLRAGG